MSVRLRFALRLALLTAGAVALIAAAAAAVWVALEPAERELIRPLLAERWQLLGMLLFFLPFVLGALLRLLDAAYPGAARRLAEEVRVIHTVNPAHRVKPAGAAEMRRLGAAINALADAHAALQGEVQARVDEAKASLEQERNRLAALMTELEQSVLVCNREGRILLYNARATELLQAGIAPAREAPVGLGRSVFGILDKGPIVHGLDKIVLRLAQGEAHPVAHFVTVRGGRMLRAQMAPVLEAACAVGGFVLILEDITRQVEADSRRDLLLQQLTEGSRAALANIRAAVETVQRYPDMEAERRQRLTEVIRAEAEALSQRLDGSLAREAEPLHTPWPLEDMLASDLVSALRRNFETGLGLRTRFSPSELHCWLSVDSHAVVQALTHVMGRIIDRTGLQEAAFELGAAGRFARLAVCWHGEGPEPAELQEWVEQPFMLGGEGHRLSLHDVLQRHGGELWCQRDPASGVHRLFLQLPGARTERPAPPPAVAPGRPVYYDFDLFNQPGQSPQLDERLLSELAYTVFDTETTGLSPSEGDEIISLGAVRIVNGRLLRQECFDMLVRPRRAVRPEAQQVHGISNEMLAGEPDIAEVLPAFARFAEDTVLVAHNAAFDMRFLQLAQDATGVVFGQPVLDTLLLSALAHPGHPDAEHRLEQIAARLGVSVVGRHTALGDAFVTGEVFLKLIPLLAERGIRTLGQARQASQKTVYAKLEY
ncbi:MAG: exonuclease domain-containing protein [Pseudomonadota bacterium]